MAEQNPFPPLVAAPFWQPITPDHLGQFLNDPPEPGCLDLASGWELALFSINQAEADRHTIWGWVRGDFGVSLAKTAVGTLGCITHLGSGFRVGLFLSEEEAAFAADLLQPVTDWAAVTPSSARHIGPDVFAALLSAGFQRVVVTAVCVAETETAWAREAGATH